MSATISAAGAGDRDALVTLLAVQLAEHNVGISNERLAAAVDGALADPRRGRFWLARRGERAIGVAYISFQWTLEHGGQCAWLEELYVVPEHRNDGVGSLLLHAVMSHARAAGCTAIDLEVEEDHQRAERLYQREGFRPHRRRRWVYTLAPPLNLRTLEP